MTQRHYKTRQQVDLGKEFPRNLKTIIDQVSRKKRSTIEKNLFAKNFILKLLESYQVRNKQKFTLSQVNYIISMMMQKKKYTKRKLLRDLFISKKEILNYLGISNITNTDYSESDKEFFKNLNEFETKHGIK